ncbi:MAG TPA: GAF domain-containing protein, partial [Burkholderiales bacterium]
TVLAVPLVRGDELFGVITVWRYVQRLFTEREVDLVKTFTAQAVIAVQNVRLFNETKEALEQQTATADILRVISSSPATVQPVFEAILGKATDLCEAQLGVLFLLEGDVWRMVSHRGASPEAQEAHREIRPGPNTGLGRMRRERRAVHIEDLLDDADTAQRDPVRMSTIQKLGARTFLAVPLLKDGNVIGAVVIYRKEVRPFGEAQIRLVGTFADQAVIAIENVRLFNETKEALEQQTATADVLKVISASPTDVAPVFDAILKSAVALCDAELAAMFSYDGKLVDMVAAHNWPREAQEYFAKVYPSPPSPKFLSGRTILSKALVQIPDAAADEHYDPRSVVTGHWRRMVGVPMLREGEPLGAIMVAWRDPGETPRRQVELLQTFADQAAIAVGNVRLFNETKEALEQQTATADVLKVISGSRTDVAPVFDAILKSAVGLCDAELAAMFSYDGKLVDMVATHNWPREAQEYFAKVYPSPPSPKFLSGRTVLGKSLVEIADAAADENYDPNSVETGHWRRMLGVPLMRGGEPLGAMVVAWREPGQTPRRQVELLQTFADQAAMAIENVRLFNETKESLEQQTAISEVLRVISSSPADVQPVLDAVAERAARICAAQYTDIVLVDRGGIRVAAGVGDLRRTGRDEIVPLDRGTVMGRSIIDRTPIHIADVLEGGDEFPRGRAMALQFGHRALLAVPLIRENRALGTILVRRTEAKPFEDKLIALLQTFADQAAIAIENVRLFNETAEALERQTATSEILKVISRTIFDLQPVLEIVLSNARKLCEADRGFIFRPDENGDYRPVAHAVPDETTSEATDELFAAAPIKVDRASATGRAMADGVTVHIPDVLQDPLYQRHDVTRLGGYRTILAVPMLRAGSP